MIWADVCVASVISLTLDTLDTSSFLFEIFYAF